MLPDLLILVAIVVVLSIVGLLSRKTRRPKPKKTVELFPIDIQVRVKRSTKKGR